MTVVPFAGYDGDGSKGYTGENMQAWFDEIEGRYYVCATQKSARVANMVGSAGIP
jgi:hypothetical protein